MTDEAQKVEEDRKDTNKGGWGIYRSKAKRQGAKGRG